MTDEFFPGFAEAMAKRASSAEAAYAVKMLETVLKGIVGEHRAKELVREAGDEFSPSWFDDNLDCPFALVVRKLKVSPLTLLKSAGFSKSSLWEAYFEAKQHLSPTARVALIFPLAGCGHYVMHSDPTLPLMPGYHTILRQALSEEKRLVITPLQAFIDALGKVWSPA